VTWAAVVGSEDPRHLRSGTQVDHIRSREGVMYYASKYICKVDSDEAGPVGRWWGMHNRGEIPWAEIELQELESPTAYRIMRVARHYINAQLKARNSKRRPRYRARCGMTFYCRSSWWLEHLGKLG